MGYKVEVDPDKRKTIEDAEAVALEWVTDMRLNRILDKLGNPRIMAYVPKIITSVTEDVIREAGAEIVDTKQVRKAIGGRAVQLYKKLVQDTKPKERG